MNGVRFHLTMKTSTEESTRLMAAVLQQQLREVGIALDIRTFEFATFFSDVTQRSVSALFPALDWRERRSGHLRIRVSLRPLPSQWRQPRLLRESPSGCADRSGSPANSTRIRANRFTPKSSSIFADDLPYINLWYFDNVLVHSKRVLNSELESFRATTTF